VGNLNSENDSGHWPVGSKYLIRFFKGQTISPGILSLPELADGFRRLIQPLTIRQQRDQFDGAKKLHRVRLWSAQCPQFARADENADIFRRAVQELRYLGSKQSGRQIFAAQVVIAAWITSPVL